MMWKHLLVFVFIITYTYCQDVGSLKKNYIPIDTLNPQPRNVKIIGGDEAVPHSYPFMVGLEINGKSFCGGTLISQNYVLTAAHCGRVIQSVEVILGVHNVSAAEPSQVRIPGDNVTVHEDFDPKTYQNDIALIKLSTPAPLNDVIKLINLPPRSSENNTYYAAHVTSLGWGFVDDDASTIDDMSDVLRFVNITILDVYSCGDYYSDGLITELNVCTSGHKNKGTCNGDSGGPLIFENQQIGIVSMGTILCEMCSPSVYTNVGKYLDWIAEYSDVVVS